MTKLKNSYRSSVVAIVAAAALALSACSSGPSIAKPDLSLIGQPVSTSFTPANNGFFFPNFTSYDYLETFDKEDLVAMVGTNAKVCVDAVALPCVLTKDAEKVVAAVNKSIKLGNCEGMIVIAATRFNIGATPATSALADDELTIKTIVRAYATMFLPEVQAETKMWESKSVADTVAVLAASLKTGKLNYGLGIYTKDGGHEVLPYAIEYPSKDVARIMVYDSNWPQKERYIDVNLTTEQWRFSFGASNQATDEVAWTGGHEDMSLNSNQARINGLTKRLGEGAKPTGPLWQTGS